MTEIEAFAKDFDVSRETMVRLEALREMILKWNARINLIGRSTEGDLWRRHFADCAQLWRFLPVSAARWADLGSGAGLPGLVVAAFTQGSGPAVTLVESDTRKAVFLGEASRAMGVEVRILHDRIEALPPLGADVLSARALAPLDTLLGYAEKHLAPGGIGLFPKGAAVHKEIADAKRRRRFSIKLHPSVTSAEAVVVEVGALTSE